MVIEAEGTKMDGELVGEVTHYFGRISVAALALTDTISTGDTVHILGHTTDLKQKISSMQIEHDPVDEAGPGQDVALKVDRKVRRGDKVYKIAPSEEADS
jgi:putative protease